MNNAIEYLIIEMLSTGSTVSEIVCEIASMYTLYEVYNAGALRFEVDAEGDIVCIGSTFVDGFVSPKDYSCLEDIYEKFMEYFNRAVYVDLSGMDYLIKKISYRDMDQFQALSHYVWDYLKRRIDTDF